ncbi:hypothetical protein BCR35DRAFT_298472, partial [Leucosporidium creatinivorum]
MVMARAAVGVALREGPVLRVRVVGRGGGRRRLGGDGKDGRSGSGVLIRRGCLYAFHPIGHRILPHQLTPKVPKPAHQIVIHDPPHPPIILGIESPHEILAEDQRPMPSLRRRGVGAGVIVNEELQHPNNPDLRRNEQSNPLRDDPHLSLALALPVPVAGPGESELTLGEGGSVGVEAEGVEEGEADRREGLGGEDGGFGAVGV